jgi:hypothetical protein
MLSRIRGELRIRFTYSCSVCGRTKEGSSSTISVDVASSSDLLEDIKTHRGRSREMPNGWSHYVVDGRDVYRCENCKE